MTPNPTELVELFFRFGDFLFLRWRPVAVFNFENCEILLADSVRCALPCQILSKLVNLLEIY